MAEISAKDLIAKFQYALDNHWGYIWGTAGVLWTEAKQKAATREMTVKYGSKWIGHTVADCSGLFSWAFKQLGGTMYHGSNTMYDKYCAEQGTFTGGKRTDGKELKAGTALFTGDKNNKGHVGLYIGNGYVIEAQGTQAGVVKSKASLKKWTYWGELKGVKFDGEPQPEPPKPEKGTAVVTGNNLALRQGPGTDKAVITRIPNGKTVKLRDVPDEWRYVEYNGKTGFVMTKFIREG